jgi:hypothetical protein
MWNKKVHSPLHTVTHHHHEKEISGAAMAYGIKKTMDHGKGVFIANRINTTQNTLQKGQRARDKQCSHGHTLQILACRNFCVPRAKCARGH